MKSSARIHSRSGLLFAACFLALLCSLHESRAQVGRPPGVGGAIGNVGGAAGIAGRPGGAFGNAGGAAGIPGGAFGNAGGAAGIPGGAFGNAGGVLSGNLGRPAGGIPGLQEIYTCSRCGARVSQTAATCPSCRATFTGTTRAPGAGGAFGGSPPPGFNQPGGGNPGDWDNRPGSGSPPVGTTPPQIPPSSTPPTTTTPSTSSSTSSDKEGGLSAPLIIGIGVVGLGLLAGIAAAILMSQKSEARPKRKKRIAKFRPDDDYS